MKVNSVTAQIMKLIITYFKHISFIGLFILLCFILYINVAFLNFIRFSSGCQPRCDKISRYLISYVLPEMTRAALFCNFCKFSIK